LNNTGVSSLNNKGKAESKITKAKVGASKAKTS
jgi:hypothetical protein